MLRNKEINDWEAAGRPVIGKRPGEGTTNGTMQIAGTTVEMPRYGVFPPMPEFTGDCERAALYAGESCSLINDIKPAGEIVADIVREAEGVLRQMKQ